ncbi:MAG: acylphosphatase [archaeon]
MSEITKKRLIIEGEKVHDVGYRLFLMDLADDFLIPYFSAKNKINDGKQQVVVLIGGEKQEIENFIASARKEYPPNAKVDDAFVSDYDGKIRSIESFSRSFSTSQLSKIANAGVHMLGKQDQTIKEISNLGLKQDKTLDNQDKSITLQKHAAEKLDDIHKDLSEKQDKTIEILAETKKDLSGKLGNIHNDLSVNLKSFHQDTISRFDIVDKKYGMIAQNMEKIFREMKEERIETRKTMKELIGAVLKVAEKK